MSTFTEIGRGRADARSTVHPTATLYRESEVIGATLAEKTVVGDFSRIQRSTLAPYVKIDRNNLIQGSTLGRLSYTGAFTVIQSAQIGSFCSISWGVTIGGGEHDYSKFTTHDFLYNPRYELGEIEPGDYDRYGSPCQIGHDVWVGANANVLRGVNVGTGAVIGAAAVVTRDVPAYAIVAGNPARVIKYRFPQAIIEQLLRTAWWDFELEKIRQVFAELRTGNLQTVLKTLSNS